MQLFIDSTQATFAAVLMKNYKPIYKSIIKTKYKVEEIIKFFEQISNIDEIVEIYLNIGPGSFVGSRAALIYVRTLAQAKKNINFFTCTTFDILIKQTKKRMFLHKIYINATKNKSYCFYKQKILLVSKNKNEKEINYEELINNFMFYKDCFKLENINNLKPNYVSEPQIGSEE